MGDIFAVRDLDALVVLFLTVHHVLLQHVSRTRIHGNLIGDQKRIRCVNEWMWATRRSSP